MFLTTIFFFSCRFEGHYKSNSFIVVNYVNIFVEYIDFRKIFKMEQVTKAAPFKSKSHQQPTLSYKYPPTIRSKVLNYKKVFNEANIDSETLKSFQISKDSTQKLLR